MSFISPVSNPKVADVVTTIDCLGLLLASGPGAGYAYPVLFRALLLIGGLLTSASKLRQVELTRNKLPQISWYAHVVASAGGAAESDPAAAATAAAAGAHTELVLRSSPAT